MSVNTAAASTTNKYLLSLFGSGTDPILLLILVFFLLLLLLGQRSSKQPNAWSFQNRSWWNLAG